MTRIVRMAWIPFVILMNAVLPLTPYGSAWNLPAAILLALILANAIRRGDYDADLFALGFVPHISPILDWLHTDGSMKVLVPNQPMVVGIDLAGGPDCSCVVMPDGRMHTWTTGEPYPAEVSLLFESCPCR